MGDHHAHHRHRSKNLKTAFWLNLSFSIIELAGGLFTNSVAILADALHDLGDSVSLGLAWYLEKVAGKKRDASFSYGYGRFSLLAAFINGLILISGSAVILIHAVPRLFNPQNPDTGGMIVLGILGVIFNGIAVWRLHRGRSLNEKIILWHFWEDIFGWIAVLIGAVIMHFTYIPVLDPLLSVSFTLFILYQVVRNILKVSGIFMQGIPADIDLDLLAKEINSLHKVESIHDLHIWSLDGETHILTIHVKLTDDLSKPDQIDLKKQIRKITQVSNVQHLTLELEYKDEDCELKDC